jgi:hypothetical protein
MQPGLGKEIGMEMNDLVFRINNRIQLCDLKGLYKVYKNEITVIYHSLTGKNDFCFLLTRDQVR